MDLYDTTFFSNKKEAVEVDFMEDKATYYPLTISINVKKPGQIARRVIKIHMQDFIEVYQFVQSVNESYEKLLAAKEG